MQKNFKVTQGVEVSTASTSADLHNCYVFKEMCFDAEARFLELTFTRNTYGTRAGSPSRVRLQFKGLRKFQLSGNLFDKGIQSVEEVGYKPPDDHDLDWLVPEERATEQDDLIVRFANDEFVRVFADFATLAE